MVRIVLVDDHTGVREGAALVLEQEPEFEVVGQADSPRRPATCPSPGHRRVCRVACPRSGVAWLLHRRSGRWHDRGLPPLGRRRWWNRSDPDP